MKKQFGFLSGMVIACVMMGCSGEVSDRDTGGVEDVAGSSEQLRLGKPCGGPRDRECGARRYCERRGCDDWGVCQRRPEVCTREYNPVCGCDGKTYGNPCEAAASGASVASQGECSPRVFCGGIAGFPCPGAGTCIDDPSDECDPNQGGADCGGLCRCEAIAQCKEGYAWNGSPEVCGCEPLTNPCAAVLCLEGTSCEVIEGEPVCVPISGQACGSVTCAQGLECCNASCGTCVRPGMSCIQIACD